MKIRVLSCDDVRQALPMKAAIEASKKAFSRLSSGRVEMPLRSRIHIPEQEGVLLTMPEYENDCARAFLHVRLING